jgi:hypothetical protein
VHITYKDLLPYSRTCDHNNVTWETNEPHGATYIEVSVSCKGCGASVSDVQIEKR